MVERFLGVQYKTIIYGVSRVLIGRHRSFPLSRFPIKQPPYDVFLQG